jgi:hypothetical protein
MVGGRDEDYSESYATDYCQKIPNDVEQEVALIHDAEK